MKKTLALVLLIIIFPLCFASCGKKESPGGYGSPLQINGLQLDGEIFAYYLSEVYDSSNSKDLRIAAATEKCIRYVAVNSTLAANGLSLTEDEIASATEEADTLWNMFGVYYKSIGVSKATFVKIHISDMYTEKLRTAFYGKGGTEEIGDAYLRGALSEYYVAYRTVTVPFYNIDVYGNKIAVSDEEKAAIREAVTDGTSRMNSGQNIEAVASEIQVTYPLCEYSSSTIVSGYGSVDVTADFIEQVRNINENAAGTIETDNEIMIVFRENILSDSSVLEEKREDCLKILSDGPLDSKVTQMCNAYSAIRNTETVYKYYSDIEKVRVG